jgi:ubiquitin C-terminal hydrolase
VLIINFERFKSCQEGFDEKYKHDGYIDYPLELDLKDYELIDENCFDGGSTIYDLYACSIHLGDVFGGHYIACCKNAQNGKWYEFDDINVK